MKKLTGRLLLFDKKDYHNQIFPKDSKIAIPEKCPVLVEFRRMDLSDCIGTATIKKDDRGLTCDLDIFEFDPETMRSIFDDSIHIGGLYTGVHSHEQDGLTVIDKMRLQAVSLTLLPVDLELKVDYVKEDKKDD